jgi:TolB-like protein/DNA-binding winged helix-turn-helix (wHTH) protein/tetratricopeptide (TPR) repeat protein
VLPAPASSDVFVFGSYRLDLGGGGLFRESEDGRVPVALGSRALDILELLVARRGELVTKEQIFAAIWPNLAVEESNLTVQIAALRRVLDEGRAAGSCIQTVSGRGYRFVAAVVREPGPGAAQTHSAVATADNSSTASRQSDERQSRRPQPPTSLSPSPPVGHSRLIIAASLILAAAVVGGAFWTWSRSSASPAFIRPAPADLAERLSIIVLPFANLSNDPGQEYFADAVTDDLTTDISRLSDSFVIARTTAYTYKGKPADVRQIGNELGVRYVLEGTVRRFGNDVRVTAQLIDTETGAHLWADRFDGDASDPFILEDEITRRIAITLGPELNRAAADRPTNHPIALDYIFRGRAAFSKPPSRENRAEQVHWFEGALALDPGSVEAKSQLAIALTARVLDNMTETPTADLARAEVLAGQAVSAEPRRASAHYARGQVLRAQRRWTEAISEYEAVLAINRNVVVALFALGQCKLYSGAIDETIPLEERAIRLSPRDPLIGLWFFQIGRVHLLQSRTDEAIRWLEESRKAMPESSFPYAELAAAYALKGETDRAASELSEARRLSADDRYSSMARLRANYHWLIPSVRALFEATYFVGLRKAGLPEE